MKSIFFSTILILLVFNAFAQKPISQTGIFTSGNLSKATTDTLWPGNATQLSDFVLVKDSSGGYVLGTNSYHTIAVGQHFQVPVSYEIESALYWFGDKKVTAGDSITFAVWLMDSLNGYTMAGDNQPAPGTQLTSYRTSLTQVDTSSTIDGAYLVTFDHPVIVIDNYVIGFDYSSFVSDSIGLVSTANGDGLGNELVWEKWGINGSWHTLQASGWGFPALLDIDAMILPLIDMTQAGLQEAPVVNGLSCTLWPNPAHKNLHLVVNAMAASENSGIKIIDMCGKIRQSSEYPGLHQGENALDLTLEGLTPGVYFCILTSGNAKYALKFVVE